MSYDALSAFSAARLAAIHNILQPDRQVKKFADASKGRARVAIAMQAAGLSCAEGLAQAAAAGIIPAPIAEPAQALSSDAEPADSEPEHLAQAEPAIVAALAEAPAKEWVNLADGSSIILPGRNLEPVRKLPDGVEPEKAARKAAKAAAAPTKAARKAHEAEKPPAPAPMPAKPAERQQRGAKGLSRLMIIHEMMAREGGVNAPEIAARFGTNGGCTDFARAVQLAQALGIEVEIVKEPRQRAFIRG